MHSFLHKLKLNENRTIVNNVLSNNCVDGEALQFHKMFQSNPKKVDVSSATYKSVTKPTPANRNKSGIILIPFTGLRPLVYVRKKEQFEVFH